MTKALVTGATGFLGAHVCARLIRMGWQVAGMGRDETEGAKLEAQRVRFVKADLRDKESVVRACAGQDVVFHCGALSSNWGAYRQFQTINVEGTKNIVEGCRRHEVNRLIHISTPSIYFDGHRERLNIREHDPLPPRPVNAYAATKLEAERVVFEAFVDGQSGLILRPRAIFGPLDRSLLPRLLRANESGGIPLIRGGRVMLDLTYVDNVVDAMLLGWEAPNDALGQAYNITNGEPAMLIDVLKKLFALMGIPLRTRSLPYPVAYGAAAIMEWSHRMLPMLGEPALTRFSISVLTRSGTFDIAQARERLGYSPNRSLDEGLKHFAEWWRIVRR